MFSKNERYMMKDKQKYSDIDLTEEELKKIQQDLIPEDPTDLFITRQKELMYFLEDVKDLANGAKTPEDYVAFTHCVSVLIPELMSVSFAELMTFL